MTDNTQETKPRQGRWDFIDEDRKESKRQPVMRMKKKNHHSHSHSGGGSSNRPQNFEEVNKRYKAAGIIPYCFIDGEMHILIGKQKRSGDTVYTWSAFCGEREENHADCIDTAVDKFSRETVGMFAAESLDALVSQEKTDMTGIYRASCEMLRTQINALIEKNGLHSFGRYIMPEEYQVMLLEFPHIDPSHFDSMLVMNDNQEDPAHQIQGTTKHDVVWVPVQEISHLVQMGDMREDCSDAERYEWFEDEEEKMQYLHHSFAKQIRVCTNLIQDIMRRNQATNSDSMVSE